MKFAKNILYIEWVRNYDKFYIYDMSKSRLNELVRSIFAFDRKRLKKLYRFLGSEPQAINEIELAHKLIEIRERYGCDIFKFERDLENRYQYSK